MKSLTKKSLASLLLTLSISSAVLSISPSCEAAENESNPSSAATFWGLNNPLDFKSKLEESDFAFVGKIIDIQYRNSRKGIPHTFVTYSIETPLKGQYDNTVVTLRFLGGIKKIHENRYDRLRVSHMPEFNQESTDFIFARRNGEALCPLAGCSDGRFKIIEKGFITTEEGRALGITDKGELVFLPKEPSKDTHKNEDSGEQASTREAPKINAKPLSADQLIQKIQSIAKNLPASTQALQSVELDQPFSMPSLKSVAMPETTEEPTQAEDDRYKSDADRQEEALLKENGYDPVLK